MGSRQYPYVEYIYNVDKGGYCALSLVFYQMLKLLSWIGMLEEEQLRATLVRVAEVTSNGHVACNKLLIFVLLGVFIVCLVLAGALGYSCGRRSLNSEVSFI